MGFLQTPPSLGNQFSDDAALRGLLSNLLPADVLEEIEPGLLEMGRISAELYPRQVAERADEPRLVRYDAWGQRVDRIELTPLWLESERIAAEKGVVATAYERRHGRYSRIHQFALAYLFTPSTDIYSCPLAMTDGAARVLLDSGNEPLIRRAVPHLTTRDPDQFWTSGQWMTETIGGSDVSRTETEARRGDDGGWRLFGRKWFTSAISSQMALTLARPEGAAEGSRGLALFYVETQGERGTRSEIRVDRLKDKLGTRKLPTAELTLEGLPATPVSGLTDGVRSITPMLNITRTWNAVSACALMRRGIALARDYADRRSAFGRRLADQPLHAETLAELQAEFEGALHLTFRVAELIGKAEAGEISDDETTLLRVLTPIAKLTTARQGVRVVSECLEAFGGAGYVEDTGLPTLLRDAQVLTIWEGTTNVLALDTLRALGKGGMEAIVEEIDRLVGDGDSGAAEEARQAIRDAAEWYREAVQAGDDALQAGARRLALTTGLAMELALLVRHSQSERSGSSGRAASSESARRLGDQGINRIRRFGRQDG